MEIFQQAVKPGSEGIESSAGSWSPAPGIVDAYPVGKKPCPAPAEAVPDACLPDPLAPARQPLPPVASAGLDIDSLEALAEADYLCAVSTLRSLAVIESGLAALKARTIERLDAASTRLGVVAELDPWQREILAISTTAELCAALTLPQRTGGELKTKSIALVRAHPDTLAALTDGSISWRNATVILDQLETLESLENLFGERAIPDDSLRGFEHQLLELAPGMTTAKFLLKARRLRERAHPDSLNVRHAKAVADRKLVLLPDKDGMSWLSMFLPADSAQGIWNQATRTARALQGPGEHRTLTQLRVDVLAQWLLETGSTPAIDCAPGCHPRPRAQVLVTVPLLALLGRSIEPGELEGYGPIPPRMARELADGCPTLYRIMVDPCTNEYLSMDPKQYRVTGAVRALLQARDGTCSFPGCNTVTDDTELDHLLAWEDGGASVPENLSSECGVHHRLKHFKDRKSRDGRRSRSNTRRLRDSARDSESKILDGWTPESKASPGEKPAWLSPAGSLYLPEPSAESPPLIPAAIAIEAISELRERRRSSTQAEH